MDHGFEAGIELASAHGDPFELLELAKEVLDQVPPLVDLPIDLKRCLSLRHLRYDDLGAALVEFADDPVGIERLVGNQTSELDVLNKWRDTNGVISVPG